MTVAECLDKHFSGKEIEAKYGKIYERHFAPIKDNPIRLLELGVAHGASMRSWMDYFSYANLIGFDQFTGPDGARVFETVGAELAGRGRLFKFNQSSRESIIQAIQFAGGKDGPFDVIIDDCSHYDHDQQISLGILFKYLKFGGMYFIEDVCVSPDTRAVAERFIGSGRFWSQHLSDQENDYVTENAVCTLETPTLLLFKKK